MSKEIKPLSASAIEVADQLHDDVDPVHREEAKGYFKERYAKEIDWTKPIQFKVLNQSWQDVVFVKNLEEHGVLAYYVHPHGPIAIINKDMSMWRNKPPVPRTCEAWVNVHVNRDGSLRITAMPSAWGEDECRDHGRKQKDYFDTTKITYTEKPKE